LGFAQSRFSAPFFDRLVYLSQSIHQTRKPDVPWMILVSRDKYLCTGLQLSPSPVNHCCGYDGLEEALGAIQLWPSARVVIDVESQIAPWIELLDALRKLALYPPYTPITLLVRADNYEGRLLCRAAGPFHVIERQLSASALPDAFNPPPLRASPRGEWFSADEWRLLSPLACGHSLKAIARESEQPYARVVYRVSRILNKLGLSHRQELLHLLSRLPKPLCTADGPRFPGEY
jgi:fimbrial protein FimY